MGKISDELKAGDVITSRLLNNIIALLNEHEDVVAATRLACRAVVIEDFIPSPPFRVGQNIRILGANFGLTSGKMEMYFDGKRISEFEAGSGDALVHVKVPELMEVGSGRDVQLAIANGFSSAVRVVKVLPSQSIQEGNIDVLVDEDVLPNPEPNPIRSQKPVTIAFVIKSAVMQAQNVDLTIGCSDSTMLESAQLLGRDHKPLSRKQIFLKYGQRERVLLFFPSVSVPAEEDFSVTLSASVPGISGGITRNYVVGAEKKKEDPSIKALLFENFASMQNEGVYQRNTVFMPIGGKGILSLSTAVCEAGRYIVRVAPLPPTQGWGLSSDQGSFLVKPENLNNRDLYTETVGVKITAGVEQELNVSAQPGLDVLSDLNRKLELDEIKNSDLKPGVNARTEPGTRSDLVLKPSLTGKVMVTVCKEGSDFSPREFIFDLRLMGPV